MGICGPFESVTNKENVSPNSAKCTHNCVSEENCGNKSVEFDSFPTRSDDSIKDPDYVMESAESTDRSSTAVKTETPSIRVLSDVILESFCIVNESHEYR